MEWEEERIALLNKIRELNEKYAEFFNREVEFSFSLNFETFNFRKIVF